MTQFNHDSLFFCKVNKIHWDHFTHAVKTNTNNNFLIHILHRSIAHRTTQLTYLNDPKSGA